MSWINLSNLTWLDLSANAIHGNFPNTSDAHRLLLQGGQFGDIVKFNLDNNQIESFETVSDVNNTMSFVMFPPDFIEDVVTSLRSNFTVTRQNQPWLSLKNNQLRGSIHDTVFEDKISLSGNDYWCTLFDLPRGIYYESGRKASGDITPFCYGHLNSMIGIGAVYGTVQPTRESVGVKLPQAVSKNEVQSLTIVFYIQCLYFDCRGFTLPAAILDQNPVLHHDEVVASVSLTVTSLDVLCTPSSGAELVTVVYDSFDNVRIQSCVGYLELNATIQNRSLLMWRRPVRLLDMCDKGRGHDEGLGQCLSCPVHTFSEGLATPDYDAEDLRRTCTPCPFSAKTNQSSVTIEASATSVSQCVCPTASYGLPASQTRHHGLSSIDCRSCPEGSTICASVNTSKPEVLPGFFWKNSSAHFLVCDPANACDGGLCKTGYKGTETNPACSACVDGYYRINRECRECFAYPEILMVLVAIAVLVGLVFLVHSSRFTETKVFTPSISITKMQLISIFAIFPVSWPATAHNMLNFLSFFNFNFDLVSPECAVKTTFWSKWLMKLFLPPLALFILFIWYQLVLRVPKIQKQFLRLVTHNGKSSCLDRLFAKLLVKQGALRMISSKTASFHAEHGSNHNVVEANLEWEKSHIKHRFVSTVVALAVLGFIFGAKTSTQPFNCLTTIIGVHLREDASVSCYDSIWFAHLPVAIVGLLFYCVSVPAIFVVVLYKAHKNNTLSDPNFRAMFGRLVIPYREQFWYWELVQLARKLFIVLCIDFNSSTAGTSTFAQINTVLAVLVLFGVAQLFVQPYEFMWCNRLESAWTLMTLTVLMAAVVLSTNQLTENQSTAYSVFLICALVFSLLTSLYSFVSEKRRSFVKGELYVFRGHSVQQEQSLLEDAFGGRVGRTIHRKMRGMDLELREEFLDRVTVFVKNSADLPLVPLSASSSKSEAAHV